MSSITPNVTYVVIATLSALRVPLKSLPRTLLNESIPVVSPGGGNAAELRIFLSLFGEGSMRRITGNPDTCIRVRRTRGKNR